MELEGEEVSQRGRRGPPFIVGATIQPLPHQTAPQRAVLPQRAAVLPLNPAVLPLPPTVLLPSREDKKTEERLTQRGTAGRAWRGTATMAGRYYRSGAVLLLLQPLQVPLNPTREMPPRVEAVVARYRSGTAAEDPQAVLPLGTAVLPLGPKTAQTAGKQTSNDAEGPEGVKRKCT